MGGHVAHHCLQCNNLMLNKKSFSIASSAEDAYPPHLSCRAAEDRKRSFYSIRGAIVLRKGNGASVVLFDVFVIYLFSQYALVGFYVVSALCRC
jgi:hypothetical protein